MDVRTRERLDSYIRASEPNPMSDTSRYGVKKR